MAYSKAYATNYDGIDWSDLKTSRPLRVKQDKGAAPMFMADIAPFVSPITYEVISSRSQLRDHEQRHGVRQCGELKQAQDFAAKPVPTNQRALEAAYRTALDRKGLL